jgi:hypothetical protein
MSAPAIAVPGPASLIDKLNTRWHRIGLITFAVVVLAHWAEHVVQAFQVWALDWPRPDSRGVLGQWFPWLVSSEWLHWAYAIFMLVGLIVFLPGFHGISRVLWASALAIQVWHFAEHLFLFIQAQTHDYWFGGAAPTSVVQAIFPGARVELHLVYNGLVTVPMILALYFHMWPPAHEATEEACTCNLRGSTSWSTPRRSVETTCT